jgi:hypothetical protein
MRKPNYYPLQVYRNLALLAFFPGTALAVTAGLEVIVAAANGS